MPSSLEIGGCNLKEVNIHCGWIGGVTGEVRALETKIWFSFISRIY